MRILVTVKEVAEVEDDFEIDGLSVSDRYLEYDLNEWDEYAIEEAVQYAETNDDVEVVSATIGRERTEETIRMALAKGVDRAIRVWDDALDDVNLLDVAAKTAILEAVVDEVEPDLVFTGVQANDDAFGATGVSLANAIGYEWAAVVNGLEIGDGEANVQRELEGGVEEHSTIETPAVFSIQTGINEPRYASLRGIRQAQSKPIDKKSLDDLGLDASVVESPLELTDMYEPASESDATIFEGSADDTAGQLAEVLRDKGVGAE